MSSRAPREDLDDTDRLQLVDLVNRYAAGVDDRRLADVAALFCADGVLVTPAGRSTPAARHEGRQAVEDALSQVSRIPATFHAVVGVVLDGGPVGEASGRVACVAHHVGPRDGADSDEVWHLVYRDRYRRTAAGWRFVSRELQLVFRSTERVSLSR